MARPPSEAIGIASERMTSAFQQRASRTLSASVWPFTFGA